MAIERLQKALARAGVASRRKIEELIGRKRVTINGEIAQLGDKVDLDVDSVKVDGKRVQPLRRPHLYLLLNKPPGYVSTVNDPENRPTVLDLLPDRLHKALFPVGRLDYDSEGLLLLTTDGEFAQKVAHPSAGCTKLYEVKVKGQPDGAAMVKLNKGIMLDGRHAAPAWVESFGGPPGRRIGRDNSWYRVALKEGRTRQIREMFFRIGHPVMRLKRTQIGGLTDPFLRTGSWRELEPREIEILLSGVEPARRVERSRGRPKVKLEEKVETVPKRPVRRRITAPLPEEGSPAAKAAKAGPAKAVPAKAGPAKAVPAKAVPAPLAERPATRPARAERPVRQQEPERREAESWEAASSRPSEEEWSTARPTPRRPEKPLFEESEFEAHKPSLFYGDDDESWDEPLDAPRPAAAAGRGGGAGRRASAAAERPRRTARVGGRPPGRAAASRPPANRPEGRSAGEQRPGRPSRPGGQRRDGDTAPARGARPAGRGEGRPPGRSDRPGRPASRPAGRDEERRPRGIRSRAAGDEERNGPRSSRPARPPRARNGAGKATPPSGRPSGRSAEGPSGRSSGPSARPQGTRPASRPGAPSGGRPSRPGGGGRPSRPDGGGGGKPRRGGR